MRVNGHTSLDVSDVQLVKNMGCIGMLVDIHGVNVRSCVVSRWSAEP